MNLVMTIGQHQMGDKMSNGTAEQYLSMWLSEQIPPKAWLEILQERDDVRELYNEHLGENK